MVEILCPHCEEEIELDDDASGEFACPYCEGEFEWNIDATAEEVDPEMYGPFVGGLRWSRSSDNGARDLHRCCFRFGDCARQDLFRMCSLDSLLSVMNPTLALERALVRRNIIV